MKYRNLVGFPDVVLPNLLCIALHMTLALHLEHHFISLHRLASTKKHMSNFSSSPKPLTLSMMSHDLCADVRDFLLMMQQNAPDKTISKQTDLCQPKNLKNVLSLSLQVI